MDFSNDEGATIEHDLNNPIGEGLRRQFDLVIDGGTIEHCFDLRRVLSNDMELLRIGGSIVIHTQGNNSMGHGFYQLSPEFCYRAFSPNSGCRIHRLVAHEEFEYARWYDVPDPASIHSRIELTNSWNAVMILAHGVRERDVPLFGGPVLQSDYAATWEAADVPVIQPAEPSHKRLDAGLKARLKQAMPSLVMAKHRISDRHPGHTRLIKGWSNARSRRRFSFEAQPDRF
jgi:hypothetical protein